MPIVAMSSHDCLYLVDIVSDHARKIVFLAKPVLLDLHFPAALNDRVPRQLAHVCQWYQPSKVKRTVEMFTYRQE